MTNPNSKSETSTDGVRSRGIGARLREFSYVLVTGLSCLAAWWFPAAKANAALGRFSYPQFLIVGFCLASFVSAVVLTFSPRAKRRRVVFRLFALWLGIGVALGCCEFAAVLLPPKNNPFYTHNEGGVASDVPVDPELPYTRPAHLNWEGMTQGDIPDWPSGKKDARWIKFQTDAEGFRNSDDSAQADLVFIGDSFTEGGNVLEEETFVRRTAKALEMTARNLGLFGYGPQAELVVLKNYGLKRNPKVVVWQFCEGNDLSDAWHYDQQFKYWQSLGLPGFGRLKTEFRHGAWQQRSPTHFLFRSLIHHDRNWYAGTFKDKTGQAHEIRFGYWPTDNHYPVGLPQDELFDGGHPGWQLLLQSLSKGKTLLAERGIKLIVVLIPMKITVMGPYVAFDKWSQERMPAEWHIPQKWSIAGQLQIVCDEMQLPFVDATPRLVEFTRSGELVYIPTDTHISARGHEIVSELIVDAIRGILE